MYKLIINLAVPKTKFKYHAKNTKVRVFVEIITKRA